MGRSGEALGRVQPQIEMWGESTALRRASHMMARLRRPAEESSCRRRATEFNQTRPLPTRRPQPPSNKTQNNTSPPPPPAQPPPLSRRRMRSPSLRRATSRPRARASTPSRRCTCTASRPGSRAAPPRLPPTKTTCRRAVVLRSGEGLEIWGVVLGIRGLPCAKALPLRAAARAHRQRAQTNPLWSRHLIPRSSPAASSTPPNAPK